jgi:hypothetical protein
MIFLCNRIKMATCHRCEKVFPNREELIKHWKSKTPCDFVCMKCGLKLQHLRAFQKHTKKGVECQYIPSKEVLDKVFYPNENRNTPSTQVTQTTQNAHNIHNGNVNNIINIDLRGMVIKHTDEMKIDKDQLLGDIVEKILFRMDTGISGKANWGTMAFTDSFHQMFAHIYANKDKPDQQNLLLKNEETRELQVFNGKEFVDDKLTSEERMLKVLNFIGDGLKWMVDNCDNYTDEEKELKSDKIGRILTGIPRFKMTYKAMFDNIFKSLKEVRDEIEKSSIKQLTFS